MSRYNHHRASRDANQGDIVACLEALGAKVLDLAALGTDAPDLYVEHAGKSYLMEVKDGKKPACDRRLRAGQLDFAFRFTVYLVECPEDAAEVLRGMRAPIVGVPRELQVKGQARRGTR